MSTPSLGAGSAGDVERLEGVIGEHYGVVKFNGVWCCACLIVLANTKVDAKVRYDAHLARAIIASPWLAAHVARAPTADRERVVRVEQVITDWEGDLTTYPIEYDERGKYAAKCLEICIRELRAALAAPHVEPSP